MLNSPKLFGEFMLSSPIWSAVYAPRGAMLVEGDFIQRLNYGKTLEKIAEQGASAFYQGEIAESSIKTIAKAGGVMTLDDVSFVISQIYIYIYRMTQFTDIAGYVYSLNHSKRFLTLRFTPPLWTRRFTPPLRLPLAGSCSDCSTSLSR